MDKDIGLNTHGVRVGGRNHASPDFLEELDASGIQERHEPTSGELQSMLDALSPGCQPILNIEEEETKEDRWLDLPLQKSDFIAGYLPQTRRSSADTNFLPKTWKQTRLSQLIRKTSFASRPMCQKTSFASRLCQKTSMAD